MLFIMLTTLYGGIARTASYYDDSVLLRWNLQLAEQEPSRQHAWTETARQGQSDISGARVRSIVLCSERPCCSQPVDISRPPLVPAGQGGKSGEMH